MQFYLNGGFRGTPLGRGVAEKTGALRGLWSVGAFAPFYEKRL